MEKNPFMGILLTNKGFLSYFYCFNKNEIFLKKFSSENFNKKKNSLKKNSSRHQVILSHFSNYKNLQENSSREIRSCFSKKIFSK